VIKLEQWHTIRSLHERGFSRRRIARELGISRNTVDRALEGAAAPAYHREAPATDQSEHDEFIRTRLSRGLRGSRILQELRAQRGYSGSQSSFYRLLKRLQTELAATQACLRFETAPGQQAQFDWAEYAVSLGGAITKVYVFGLVLGYSRRCHWFPSLSIKQPAIFEALDAGWQHFGGACRELLVDNARSLILKHTRTALVWHPLFLQLCGHYRVQPLAGTPRHPQGKGKVENPFGLLEQHFIQGHRWNGFDHFQRALGEHEARWEQRIHGTTGVAPTVRFLEEQPALIRLPLQPHFGVRDLPRQVSGDCLVSFEGVRYSVPAPYAGKTVWVRPSQGRGLTVLAPSGVVLATHDFPPAGKRLVIRQEHYAVLRRRHQARLPTLADRFRARYGAEGEVAEQFLQRFIGQATFRPDRQLARLLELLEGVPPALVLPVLADGLEFNLFSCNFLESRIEARLQAAAAAGAPPAVLPAPAVQLPLPELTVERSLETYGRALPVADPADQS
jgi:transposase